MSKGGRAFLLKVDQKLLDRVKKYASSGRNMTSIANRLGISYGTFMNYKKMHPEIHEAYMTGKADFIGDVEENMGTLAMGGSVDASKFILSRQGGPEWKEQVEVHVGVTPVIIERYRENPNDPIVEVILGSEDYSIDPIKEKIKEESK